ncbi:hypothetical protein O181_018587 [Austropuccinia psidii MF-1]|uniref:Uncharacterized protein n=1 Tax=Austropuccinia psidii MF-1 TaxID=1389203 RepID=A0A9Q3GTM8_9BASI|nr:hypothetical protein [Austropuccinia psidii MF-1]
MAWCELLDLEHVSHVNGDQVFRSKDGTQAFRKACSVWLLGWPNLACQGLADSLVEDGKEIGFISIPGTVGDELVQGTRGAAATDTCVPPDKSRFKHHTSSLQAVEKCWLGG